MLMNDRGPFVQLGMAVVPVAVEVVDLQLGRPHDVGPLDEQNSAAQIVEAVTLRGGVELADELVQAAVSDGCPLRRAPAARRDLLLRRRSTR